jgi:erythromycin esterase
MKHLLGLPAILLIAMQPSALCGQAVPHDEFRVWALGHAHPITIAESAARPEGLMPIRAVVADARVVALGEPLHGFHEPLALRNRVVQQLVTDLGFTAVALETGLAHSKRLHDYVAGRTKEMDAEIAGAFSYGFGNFAENLELLRWLRSHNASQPPARQVRLYGIDLTGEPYPQAHRALEPVFTYLERVEPGLGASVRKGFDGLDSKYLGEAYLKLPPEEKDRITAEINDLIALMRRRRIAFTAAGSRDDYEWALRQSINASQGDAQARLMPEDTFKQLQSSEVKSTVVDGVNMREVAMADNLAWVLEREGPRGRVIFFAHNSHIQKHAEFTNADKKAAPLSKLAPQINPAGLYLHSMLGREMVVIGTYFGAAEGLPKGEQVFRNDPEGLERLLGDADLTAYIIDLRELPAEGRLRDWMQAGQSARGGLFGERTHRLAPARSFDAIFYMQRASPTTFARKILERM